MKDNSLKLFTVSKFYTLVAILCFLEIANMVFMDSSMNMAICIPEFIVVLFFLFRGSVANALLLHVVFSLTTFSVSYALHDEAFMSYSSLKLFGPFTISYIILGLIWLSVINKPIIAPRHSLICKTRVLCFFLFTIATVGAVIGMVMFSYSFSHIIGPLLYMGIGILYLDIFVRLYKQVYLKSCFIIAIALLVASPISSFIAINFLGIKALYSDFDVFIMNEAFMLTPLLMLFLINPTDKKVMSAIYVALVCYIILVAQSGRGGHFLNIAICSVLFVILLYFNKEKSSFTGKKIIKLIFPVVIFVVSGYVMTSLLDTSANLANAKLGQFVSIFSVFSGGGMNLDNLANSPYMRIAEFMNIFNNEWHNPLLLITGKGYGGTYTDSLGLFYGIDLTAGSFSEKEAMSGVFATAHSMYPNVLLYHGLIGLVLFIRHGITYLLRIKYTPLVFASFSLFLYSFYFNVLLLIICLFVLFASEYKIQYKQK